MLLFACTALTQADLVCDRCACWETTVNCSFHALHLHPNASEWSKDMEVTDVLMDNNDLVHVTQYPPMSVQYLSLSHNRIVRIDNEAFLHLQNLSELDLSYNDITAYNLNSAVFQVKLPSLYEFVYLSSLSLVLVQCTAIKFVLNL